MLIISVFGESEYVYTFAWQPIDGFYHLLIDISANTLFRLRQLKWM